mgnify:CR=1 FL=1
MSLSFAPNGTLHHSFKKVETFLKLKFAPAPVLPTTGITLSRSWLVALPSVQCATQIPTSAEIYPLKTSAESTSCAPALVNALTAESDVGTTLPCKHFVQNITHTLQAQTQYDDNNQECLL